MSSKAAVISLYRNLLRESRKFSSYNFRFYALRRVRDAFRENKTETDPQKVKEFIKFGKENLEMIKRQTIIGNMYSTDKLVIEKTA